MIQHYGATQIEYTLQEGNNGWISPINSDPLYGFHIVSAFTGSTTFFGYYGLIITVTNTVPAVFLGQNVSTSSKKGKGKKKFQQNMTDIFRGGNVGSTTQALNKIGNITAAAIDPSWTNIVQVGGVCNDAIDAGTIVAVKTNDAIAPAWSGATTYASGDFVLAGDGNVYQSRVAGNLNHDPNNFANPSFWNYATTRQKNYIIKLDKTTTNIVWKVPVNAVPSADDMVAKSNCSGVFLFISPTTDKNGNYPVYAIQTQTGQYFTGALRGLTGISSAQACDSATYSVLCNVSQYNSATTGAPVARNSTVSFNTVATWCRIYIGTDTIISDSFPSPLGTFPAPIPVISITTNTAGEFPCVAGFTYTSQGQMLRASTDQDMRSPQGQGLAVTRRSHLFGMLVNQALELSVGTSFTNLNKVKFVSEGNKQFINNVPFSGVCRPTLNDGYSFDSMPCWQVTRPYPLAIAAAGPFFEGNEV
jgi:hypothetical protein